MLNPDIPQSFDNCESTVYFSNQRVKLCGFYLELSHYERDRMIGKRSRIRKSGDTEKVDKEKLTPKEIRLKSMKRAKNTITDLILCNAWQWYKRGGQPYLPIFITFTFRENVTDLTYAHNEFTNFIRRLGYDIRGKMTFLKYLAVVEFQNRGAIHYHVIFFNLPWIDRIYDKMRDEWRKGVGEGTAQVESVRSESGLIKYLCKYLTKSVEDGRLLARKSYFASKGLKKPIIHSFNEVVNLVRTVLEQDKIKLSTYEYDQEYLKHVVVDFCSLKDHPKLLREIKVDILERYAV
ncbi:MAG: rolling circle replication-associated protein [Minisyncoccota bacterium]